ncbi:hypothetical protein FOZ62_021847 [Perkinsus olseni]|uniref:Uncharacterized protein n=1 Tax=Perkinsus olseni TaxID=32597 RepID=A0A7J6NJW7_PEROL|nr:hypothetical protein FOZ62_021847 [Perkinsus olseni]
MPPYYGGWIGSIMAWNNDVSLTAASQWDKADDPTVVLDLPFDTPPTTPTIPPPPQQQSQGHGLELPASPCGTLSTCSSSDVACGMSSPPYGALPPLSVLEGPTGPFPSTPTQTPGFLGAGLTSTGLSDAFAESMENSAASTQEPGLDALSRIIAARCVDPLTLPRAAVQDTTEDQGPAPKRAKITQPQQQQSNGASVWGSGLVSPTGTDLPTTSRPSSQTGGLSPYMMLNSLRKKEYAAPPGVWKNSGGYISTVYVNKRRIYGPLRKTLAESVRDREEMLIAKENHASEEEIRELVAALKEINGGNSRGSSKGRRHRKTRKSTKATRSGSSRSTTTPSATSTTSGSSIASSSEGGLFPTIPESDPGASGTEGFPSLAARFQNENYFGGFSPDSFGFGQY